MKFRKTLISILNIKAGEGPPIAFLMGFSFFMGAAIAFFYTAATTLLLAGFETKILPWVYILSGIVGYIIWFLSSRLEKKFSFSTLMKVYTAFLTITVLLFAIALYIFNTPWIAFMMFVWIRVFLFITAVVFWGVSARLFNLRQGKRLFGLISSGEVISNIIGFLSIPILMRFIETSSLVVIAFVSLVFCFLFLALLLKRFKDKFQTDALIPVDSKQEEKEKEKKKTNVYKNKYFQLLFVMAVLPMFSIYFVDYIFLDQTKSEFIDRQVLASFLGLFLGSVAIAEFFIKTFLSGRLISKYGLKLGLTALPVMMLFSTFLASLSGTLYGVTAMFFSFVLMTKLFERAIRSSVNDPSYQILYQPLPPNERLYYQSRIEGIPKALGNTLAGLALLALTSISAINLVYFNYLFLIILLFWIKTALEQFKTYRSTLQNAISEDENIEKKTKAKDNLNILTEGIINADKENFVSLYNLLEKSEAAHISPAISFILKNGKDKLVKDILNEIKKNKLVETLDSIDDLLESGDSGDIRDDLEAASRELKEIENIRFDDLAKLSWSPDVKERIFATKLLGRSGRFNTFRLMMDLLQDNDIHVRKAALIASGKIKRRELWTRIIDHLSLVDFSNEAFSAISEIGKPILYELNTYFGKLTENTETQIRIIKLYETIGGNEAITLLKGKLNHHNRDIRYQVLLSLSKLEYQAVPGEIAAIKQSVIEDIGIIIWLFAAKNDIGEGDEVKHLQVALDYELTKKRDDVFLLLSLIYNSKTIKHVREKVESKDNDSRVYALEIIDMLVSDDLRSLIIPILDDLSYKETMHHYTYLFPQQKLSISERLADIVNKDYSKINAWTKACSLELMSVIPCDDAEQQYAANLLNPNDIIMEVAARKMFEINMEKHLDINVRLEKRDRDRLGKITKVLQRSNNSNIIFIIDKVRILKKVRLFENVPENILINIASSTEIVEIKKGDILKIKHNDQKLFVLISGDFVIQGNNMEEIKLKSHEVIGEIIPELWLQQKTDLVAKENTRLLLTDINILYGLMTDHPEISLQIINSYY